jgi:hypothetical protein
MEEKFKNKYIDSIDIIGDRRLNSSNNYKILFDSFDAIVINGKTITLDQGAIADLFYGMYGERISNIKNVSIKETNIFGVNYGTGIGGNFKVSFDCRMEDEHETVAQVDLIDYILVTYPFTFKEISDYKFMQEEIEVLLLNKHLDKETITWLKLQ